MSKCSRCIELELKIKEEEVLYESGERGEYRDIPPMTLLLSELRKVSEEKYPDLTPQGWLLIVAMNELIEHRKICQAVKN